MDGFPSRNILFVSPNPNDPLLTILQKHHDVQTISPTDLEYELYYPYHDCSLPDVMVVRWSEPTTQELIGRLTPVFKVIPIVVIAEDKAEGKQVERFRDSVALSENHLCWTPNNGNLQAIICRIITQSTDRECRIVHRIGTER